MCIYRAPLGDFWAAPADGPAQLLAELRVVLQRASEPALCTVKVVGTSPTVKSTVFMDSKICKPVVTPSLMSPRTASAAFGTVPAPDAASNVQNTLPVLFGPMVSKLARS